jgi:hypothetical protein
MSMLTKGGWWWCPGPGSVVADVYWGAERIVDRGGCDTALKDGVWIINCFKGDCPYAYSCPGPGG